MAQGADLRSRIVLDGAKELTAQLQTIGKTGEKAFGEVSSAADKSSKSFGTLGAISASLTRSLSGLRGGLSGLSGGFAGVTTLAGQLKTALAGFAAFEGLRRGVGIVGDVTQQMQELRNVSASTSFPTDTLRAFQVALDQTGNAGEKVGGAFIQFAGAVADADKAAQGASNAFTDIGVNTKSIQGVNRLNTILDVYIKRWAQIKKINPALAARSGALAFGEDDINKFSKAMELAGEVGIPKFVEAMKQFARFPTKADFASMEQYETAWGKFQGTINSIKMDAVLAVFPGLTQALENARATLGNFTGDIQRFFIDINRVLTGRQAQTEFVRNLVAMKDVVLFVFGLLNTAFQAFARGLDIVAMAANNLFGTDWTGKGIAMALVGLKLVGVFTLLATAFTAARTAWTLLSAGVLFSPFGALVAAVGLAVAYLLSGTEAAKKLKEQLTGTGAATDKTAAATNQTAQNMGATANAAQATSGAVAQTLDLTQRLGAATATAAANATTATSGFASLQRTTATPHDNAWHEMMRTRPSLDEHEVNPEVVDMATGAKMPIGQGVTGTGGGRLIDVKQALGQTAAAGFGAAAGLNAVANAASTAAAAQKQAAQEQAATKPAAASALTPEGRAALGPRFTAPLGEVFKQDVKDAVTTLVDHAREVGAKAGEDIAGPASDMAQNPEGQTVPLPEWVQSLGAEISKAVAAPVTADTPPAIDFSGVEQSADSMATSVQGASEQLGGLSTALSAVTEALNSAAAAIAAAASKTAVPGMAAGGLVPGSGTADTVAARLTPGEWVMRRSVVSQLGVPFLSMLNRGRGSHLPRGHYAMGGLVGAGAGGGGTPVHLHLGGKSFALSGGADVVSSLVQEARSSQMRSAGVKPSWFGGTPGR